MRIALALAGLLVAFGTVGCTEPNPAYRPPDSGTDAPDDAGADADADGDADGDVDVPVEADVEPADDGTAEVEDDGGAEVEDEASGDAEAEAEADVPPSDNRDGDGVLNDVDNCPDTWNPDQTDCNGDGIGDACQGGDTDGDTIPDSINLCACGPGTSTHDEDGDGVMDDCDNCPLVANATQANADHDGLGDACEPPSDPGLALTIDRFEPFVALPADPGWLAPSGTWSLGTDTYDETDAAASSTAFYDPWDRGNDLFVQAAFRVTAIGTGGGSVSKQAGVLARTITLTDGTVRWYSCGLDMAHDRLEIRLWDGAGYVVLAQVNTGIILAVDTDYRMSFLVQGSSLTCALESPVATAVVAHATDAALPLGAPGLRTYRTAVSFSALMVAR